MAAQKSFGDYRSIVASLESKCNIFANLNAKLCKLGHCLLPVTFYIMNMWLFGLKVLM